MRLVHIVQSEKLPVVIFGGSYRQFYKVDGLKFDGM